MQDKQLIVRCGLPSAMPYCKILMTLTAVILLQSFLCTWTSAPPSHKTPAFMINIVYCFFFGHVVFTI